MREIKFRQWHGNQFTYWGMDIDYPGTFTGPSTVDGQKSHEPHQQFTGLRDKNGKEIYEGDILFWQGNGKNWIVFWDEGAYRMNATDDHEPVKLNENLFGRRTRYLAVIGNVYETGELLTNK
jgi:hypothetical protein